MVTTKNSQTVEALQEQVRLLQDEVRQAQRMNSLWQHAKEQLKQARKREVVLRNDLEQRTREIEQARNLLDSLASNDRAIIDNMSEGIMITTPRGIIREVNPAFETITGYRASEAVGKSPSLLHSGRHDRAYFDALWQQLKQESRWRGEFINRRASGEIYIQDTSITEVKDWNGDTVNYVAVMQDVTRQRRDQERLKELALYDSLTGLANRRLFREKLSDLIRLAHRNQQRFAVLFVDLDGFKPINDQYGHDAGDYVLKRLARRLQNALRESDSACRFGGDEFTLLLSMLETRRDAEVAATRLLARLMRPLNWRKQPISVGASIGIAIYPDDGETFDALINSADSRMYQAKQLGKAAVCANDA